MAVLVLDGLLTAAVLNMLVVPALLLRYGVERPGRAGPVVPRREPQPAMEGMRWGGGRQPNGPERWLTRGKARGNISLRVLRDLCASFIGRSCLNAWG
jgi:hypothetical protein